MSGIKILWNASEKLMREELARDGRVTGPKRVWEIDLEVINPKQRAALAELVSFDSIGKPTAIDIRDYPLLTVEYPYVKTQTVELDAEPNLEHVIQVAREVYFRRAEHQTIQAEREASDKRHRQFYNQVLPVLKGLADDDDLDGLRNFRIDYPDWYTPKWRNSYPSRTLEGEITSLIGEVSSQREGVRREVEKARQKAELNAWIAEHGSDHLKSAHELGYEVGRLYATERFEHEIPTGWQLDFYDRAAWYVRTNPSADAIVELKLAQALCEAVGGSHATIVWLTHPPSQEPEEDDYGYFEACEAVIIRGYLGKYDLVKML